MKIAVLREVFAGENRVAATPETVGKLAGLGATIAVEAGAGAGSRIMDADYAAQGASIVPDAQAALAGAEDAPLSELRRQVTSPGGTTAAGIAQMDENAAIDRLVGRVVDAAAARSRALAGG